MNKLLIFVLGATAGSLVTWKILEEKYNRIIQEEIEAVEEYYKNKEEKVYECGLTEEEIDKVVEDSKDNLEKQLAEERKIKENYKKEVVDLGYTVETEELEEHIMPYVIAPEEYGEVYGYDKRSWTYYADGVLTNEIGLIIADPEVEIGDALEHFGEYEDDSVFVRNDNIECDIEILKHDKTYSDIQETIWEEN